MPVPSLSTPPAAPSRHGDTPAEFVSKADAFVAWWANQPAELTAWIVEVASMVSGIDFNATSTTSVTIGTGAKSLTVQTGKLFQIGQFVTIANTPAPQNYMVGQVTGYDAGTGALDVDVTFYDGSGTYDAWSIGIAPPFAEPLTEAELVNVAGDTMLGKLILAAAAAGAASLNIPAGTTPSAPDDGDVWRQGGTVYVRAGGSSNAVLLGNLTQSFWNKTFAATTLVDPAITGTIKEDVYAITDGASVDIDPGNGSIQLWTLGANRTPTAASFAAGESVTLMIADGTAYAVTWSTIGVVWSGGTAPTLPTSGYGVVVLSKVGSTVYGYSAGNVT